MGTSMAHPGHVQSRSMELNNGHISVAVRVNGELRATGSELPRNAVFPIYSITKTLTALCVLRLAETGPLRLGDSARQWLPEVDPPTAITLTQLLTSSNGFTEWTTCLSRMSLKY